MLLRYESTLLPNRTIPIAQCAHADMKTSDMLDEVELSVLADGSSIDRSTSSLLTYGLRIIILAGCTDNG